MKVNAKTIGKIQLTIGILLFLAVIIVTPMCIKSYFLKPTITGVTEIISIWTGVSGSINATAIGGEALVTSDLLTLGLIFKTSVTIFISISIMMFFLSIMFILQGLANIKRK